MSERYELLMVKVVDDMATPAERQELMLWLQDHPEHAVELETHLSMKAVTDAWTQRMELDLVQDRFDQAPAARAEKWVGTALWVIGLAVLLGFGAVEFFSDPTVPSWVRLGVGMLASGTLVLGFSVIRNRLRTYTADPYKDVIR